MMTRLMTRAEQLARNAREQQVQRIAERLRSVFRDRAVEAGQEQVRINGRGILKRWLIEPSLRFLAGEVA